MQASVRYFTWDRIVRFTHWLIVLGFFLNLFVLRPGSSLHQGIGYGILMLIIIRLIWAMTGAKYPARMHDMLPTLTGVAEHLQELKQRQHRQDKHNAVGLLFIWSAWLLLIVIALTGYLAAISSDADSIIAYNNAIEDLAYNYPFEDIHKVLVRIIEGLAAIHIIAVWLTGKITRHNYLRPMIYQKIDK